MLMKWWLWFHFKYNINHHYYGASQVEIILKKRNKECGLLICLKQ